jgi:hypothetical protein
MFLFDVKEFYLGDIRNEEKDAAANSRGLS